MLQWGSRFHIYKYRAGFSGEEKIPPVLLTEALSLVRTNNAENSKLAVRIRDFGCADKELFDKHASSDTLFSDDDNVFELSFGLSETPPSVDDAPAYELTADYGFTKFGLDGQIEAGCGRLCIEVVACDTRYYTAETVAKCLANEFFKTVSDLHKDELIELNNPDCLRMG